ncbi:PREDICTED: uncharacterized protein LOC106906944 isoform X2 [Poecilia mexicana]|uniref:uncharacterized protein LOC106906944 isoform X2 n=1 Tax=Poecilia mexicana TaxID=48701 RepID=UPI00072DA76C|nr:PREDICTED: uncharacterized protein LOC106906944 isoform X2 [Poecilia mexicana]
MLGVGVKLFLFQPQTGNIISVFRSAAEKSLSVQQLIDGQEMLVLVLVLVVLQFEGTRGEELHLYHREGENVVLPSERPSSSYRCSIVNWLYNRDTSTIYSEVRNGKVVQSSPRASRLNMDSSCSLTINNITADDAGRYICRPGSGSHTSLDGFVYLSVLSISDSDPTMEHFTLQCSLWKYGGLDSCSEKSFRWLDETGTELTGKTDDRSSRLRCYSSLTVKHQSDENRRFTCQLVEGNKVKVEAQHIQVHLYHRAGDEAVLPCNRPSSSDSCSSVDWKYKRNENMNKQEVHRGIVQSSPRSSRMSLDRNCSLIINNINADDAGWYRCSYNTDVHLNLLIISSSPPDADPTVNNFTLACSLLRFRSGSCPDKSLLWLDETGSELTGEGDGYKSGGQFGCVSFLTVNLQSSRRFTCQFIEGNKVKIEAHYQHEGCCSVSSSGPPASSPLSFIMLTLKITGLILMVGLTVGIIRTRAGRKKPQKDIKVRFAADDDTVDYENDGERSAAAALH